MRAFRCLLRGFRDLSDGTNTAILDIPQADVPDAPKEFRQKYGYFIVDEDFKALTEGLTGLDPILKQRLIDGLQGVLDVLKES